MSAASGIGDVFVDYALVKDVDKAHESGVFEDNGVSGETEERHISELARRMNALDEKETYITVRTLFKHHEQTVLRTLKYLQQGKQGRGNS